MEESDFPMSSSKTKFTLENKRTVLFSRSEVATGSILGRHNIVSHYKSWTRRIPERKKGGNGAKRKITLHMLRIFSFDGL